MKGKKNTSSLKQIKKMSLTRGTVYTYLKSYLKIMIRLADGLQG